MEVLQFFFNIPVFDIQQLIDTPQIPLLHVQQECLSAEAPPPACRQKAKHIQFDFGMTLTFVWPLPYTSQTKLNWCPGSKISIFHEMTLTLTQWPWYSNLT